MSGKCGRRTTCCYQGDCGQHAKAFIIPHQICNPGADPCAVQHEGTHRTRFEWSEGGPLGLKIEFLRKKKKIQDPRWTKKIILRNSNALTHAGHSGPLFRVLAGVAVPLFI